jgi:MFS superfamily sulfate permease-like transporter
LAGIGTADEAIRKEHGTTNRRANPSWGLISLLAAVGLVRPLLSIAGTYDALGVGPVGPLIVTAMVAALWVRAVVATRAPNPLVTLVLVGTLYGVFAILLQQIGWNLFLGGAPEGAPSSGPVLARSWVSILITNATWGAFLGLLASGLGRRLPRRVPRSGAEA